MLSLLCYWKIAAPILSLGIVWGVAVPHSVSLFSCWLSIVSSAIGGMFQEMCNSLGERRRTWYDRSDLGGTFAQYMNRLCKWVNSQGLGGRTNWVNWFNRTGFGRLNPVCSISSIDVTSKTLANWFHLIGFHKVDLSELTELNELIQLVQLIRPPNSYLINSADID